jgi:hypothetical protein
VSVAISVKLQLSLTIILQLRPQGAIAGLQPHSPTVLLMQTATHGLMRKILWRLLRKKLPTLNISLVSVQWTNPSSADYARE